MAEREKEERRQIKQNKKKQKAEEEQDAQRRTITQKKNNSKTTPHFTRARGEGIYYAFITLILRLYYVYITLNCAYSALSKKLAGVMTL